DGTRCTSVVANRGTSFKPNAQSFRKILFHIAYIPMGLWVQQGGQKHRFTLIVCLLYHQG
ncbi:MAG: hypothetical protein R6U65_04985, partial [Perlabentimonas sp.]